MEVESLAGQNETEKLLNAKQIPHSYCRKDYCERSYQLKNATGLALVAVVLCPCTVAPRPTWDFLTERFSSAVLRKLQKPPVSRVLIRNCIILSTRVLPDLRFLGVNRLVGLLLTHASRSESNTPIPDMRHDILHMILVDHEQVHALSSHPSR